MIEELMRESMRMAITPDGVGRLRFPVDTMIGAYSIQPGRLDYAVFRPLAVHELAPGWQYPLYAGRIRETRERL